MLKNKLTPVSGLFNVRFDKEYMHGKLSISIILYLSSKVFINLISICTNKIFLKYAH